MKIVTIIGARPQFIKASVVSHAIAARRDMEEVIIHTGQHYDPMMSDVFFRDLNVPEPRYNLNVNQLSHGAMTGRMLEGIEEILLKERPDMVMVYGDTNSTLAGALAAKKLHIPVAHVEAGLRSFNEKMPEEVNRVLTDHISDLLFCPTEQAVHNLQREGLIEKGKAVINVGDVMEASAQLFSGLMRDGKIDADPILPAVNSFILLTIHRAENTDSTEKLSGLVHSLNRIHEEQMPIIFPMHPRTKGKIEALGLPLKMHVVPPASYLQMIDLLDRCRLVVTDSGGLQKEAYFFNKFCLTVRDETEWVELVDAGYNQLVPDPVNDLENAVQEVKDRHFKKKHHFYGSGQAPERIAKSISDFLSKH